MSPGDPRKGSIIFHHPLPITTDASRGSALRPAKMLEAFHELGYEVVQVTGWSPDRKIAAERVMDEVRDGRRFDFVYGESATTPNALSDRSHLPRHPLIDARFLRFMHRRGVPVGVFYRDVYWRFDEYKSLTSVVRRGLARLFYRLDLLAYRASVDVLFLPSQSMADALPRWSRTAMLVAPLPPGTDVREASPKGHGSDVLELLYVGSVTPPLYALDHVLHALRGLTGVHLTICCREEERQRLPPVTENTSVVHLWGPDLDRLYQRADLAMVVFGPHPYRRFAVPIKLFEAVGHGVPVVADSDSAAGRIVREHGLGMAVESTAHLGELLQALAADPALVLRARAWVVERRLKHTWLARAQLAAQTLGRRDPTPLQ